MAVTKSTKTSSSDGKLMLGDILVKSRSDDLNDDVASDVSLY